ncbi:MAG: hypothetical protein QXP58_07075 [Thermoprotei archaeon]
MPKPRRQYVRSVGRLHFLYRMYPATGIFRYGTLLGTVVRHTENIPLYSVMRLQDILYSPWEAPFSSYRFYFSYRWFRDNYENLVGDAPSKVEDWRGIP